MKITPRQAKRMVIVSLVGTGMVVVFDKARQGEWPDPRIFVGLSFAYMVLGFTSDLAPTVAGPFAILVFIGMLLTRGQFVIDAFDAITGAPDAPRNPPHKFQPPKKNRKKVTT